MKSNNIVTGIAIIGLIVTVLVLAFTFIDFPEFNFYEPDSDNVITANGAAEREVMPDTAEISVVIETKGEDRIDVSNENADISRSVMNGIRRVGISESDIQTTGYNVYPEYQYAGGKRTEIGYIATNSLKIKLDNVIDAGDVIVVSIENGATRIGSVHYTMDKNTEEEIKSEILKEATENAKKKAESIADGLGVSLGRLVSVGEGGVSYRPYMLESATLDKVGVAASSGAIAPEINPRELTIRVSVNVVYEIK